MMRAIENAGSKLLALMVPTIDAAAVQTVCESNYVWIRYGLKCVCNRYGTAYSCWNSWY